MAMSGSLHRLVDYHQAGKSLGQFALKRSESCLRVQESGPRSHPGQLGAGRPQVLESAVCGRWPGRWEMHIAIVVYFVLERGCRDRGEALHSMQVRLQSESASPEPRPSALRNSCWFGSRDGHASLCDVEASPVARDFWSRERSVTTSPH